MLTSPSHVIVLPRSSGEDGMSLPLVGLGKVIGNANAGTGTAGSWGSMSFGPLENVMSFRWSRRIFHQLLWLPHETPFALRGFCS